MKNYKGNQSAMSVMGTVNFHRIETQEACFSVLVLDLDISLHI